MAWPPTDTSETWHCLPVALATCHTSLACPQMLTPSWACLYAPTNSDPCDFLYFNLLVCSGKQDKKYTTFLLVASSVPNLETSRLTCSFSSPLNLVEEKRKISQHKMVNHSYHECYENSITLAPNNTNLKSSSKFSECICKCSWSPEDDTWCLHLCCACLFSDCWGLNSVLHACTAAFYQWVHLPIISFSFIVWFLYLVDL